MVRSNKRIQIFDVNGEYLDQWVDISGPKEAILDDDLQDTLNAAQW